MSQRQRVHLRIRGRVQGVFYRASAAIAAQERCLVGWVRNLDDGSVEAEAEGPREALDSFVAWCHEGPPAARVDQVEVEWRPATGAEQDFRVRQRS